MSQIVKGFPPAMPPYAHLTDEEVDNLIAYIASLSDDQDAEDEEDEQDDD